MDRWMLRAPGTVYPVSRLDASTLTPHSKGKEEREGQRGIPIQDRATCPPGTLP